MFKKLFCAALLCAAAIVTTATPTTALPRTECTSDGPVTTCCGSCGCCTWLGDGNGPNCKSWC